MGGNDLVWEITANGGVGGSKGLDISFDGTDRVNFYSVGIYDFEPVASDANPLANGTVSSASQLRFSVDIKTVGNLDTTPITLAISQRDEDYEADRSIDANMDGDMVDAAYVFISGLTPVISTSGDYYHLSFTFDEGDLSAYIQRNVFPSPPTKIPLTPTFDPTVTLLWGISGMNDDEFRIETVPAPGDFNSDGFIDEGDYTLWRSEFGSDEGGTSADGNKDGVVNAADYIIWRNNMNGGAGNAATRNLAVPEPAFAALLTLAAAMTWAIGRGSRCHRCT
jgi:hypothetical protein